MAESKYAVLKGKTLLKRDLVDWDEGKYITFLRFCEQFVIEKDGKHMLSVTKERWRKAEEIFSQPDHPFNEFLFRINWFTWINGATEKKFAYKLYAQMRIVLLYLRENPAFVTEKMLEIIEPNEKFNWCLRQVKTVETAIGPVVVPDNETHLGKAGETQTNSPSYEARLIDSMVKVTDVMVKLAKSITANDYKALTAKEKFNALARMSYVFQLSKSVRPSKAVFKQLNINHASREDLEAAMLEMRTDD